MCASVSVRTLSIHVHAFVFVGVQIHMCVRMPTGLSWVYSEWRRVRQGWSSVFVRLEFCEHVYTYGCAYIL